jgi:hypothetical protein
MEIRPVLRNGGRATYSICGIAEVRSPGYLCSRFIDSSDIPPNEQESGSWESGTCFSPLLVAFEDGSGKPLFSLLDRADDRSTSRLTNLAGQWPTATSVGRFWPALKVSCEDQPVGRRQREAGFWHLCKGEYTRLEITQ